MGLDGLRTPCLLLDRARLQANLDRMARRMDGLGVRLRPHLKTAKSVDVARLALERGAVGLTVSTLREAEYFAGHGLRDLTYAVPLDVDKLEPIEALRRSGARIAVLVDDPETCAALVERSTTIVADGGVLDVRIEVDSGEGRTGVDPAGPALLEIAARLRDADRFVLGGVLTHAGHSYRCRSVDEIRRVAGEERGSVVRAAGRLREAGFDCPVVSAGSTPTAVHAQALDGVTEMRPGVYMFGDLTQLALGSHAESDIALSVLARVIAHNRRAGRIVIDAGALALSKDLGRTDPAAPAYGELCDRSGTRLGLTVGPVYQEHGLVSVRDDADWARLPVGSLVRVLPNHACLTAAAHDCYHLMESGSVVDEWPRANGW